MIKTESKIAQNLGIKQETLVARTENQTNADLNRKQATSNEVASKEKQRLMETIVSLKTQNQKITFDLKTKQKECVKLIAEKSVLEQGAIETSAKITKLELDLSHLKTESDHKLNQYKRKAFDLNQQNQTLSARIKQLQSAMAQNSQIENKTENNIYEVEKIIDEKKVGKMQYYLVRWKGFGANDDTWEKEANLMCPTILKDYLRDKK